MKGHWPVAARVTERRGLLLSGALVAAAEPLTQGLIAGSPALMVHHVGPGSEAESAGLVDFDLILSVDGAPVESLDALRDKARMAEATDQPLELMLLRFSSEAHDQLFAHERRLLPVQHIQPVGPGSSAAPRGPAVH